MSANLIVDLGNTALMGMSVYPPPLLSGGFVSPGSGAVIGAGIDLANADTFCNLLVIGAPSSGTLRVAVQSADADTSGSYTDPTSGLPQMPTSFSSGGVLVFGSGTCLSGIMQAAGFQRTGRYVRANLLAEATAQYAASLEAGFVSQLRTTGSGGGYSTSPTSGVVNV